jgi:hypothetical protein
MSAKQPSYVIWRTYGAGFWSIVASTLAHCDIATQNGFVPVVDMEKHTSVYNEDQPVHGTKNMWEYYFKQPAGRSLAELGPSPARNNGTIPSGYPRELGDDAYRALWQKYAKLQPHIEDGIKDTIKGLGISQTTLGVHFRGQEMRTAIGHKFPPTLGQMNTAIAHVLETSDFEKILLVTEAEQYVSSLRRKWGSRLIVSPTFRLWRRNSYTQKRPPRPEHRFNLGREALQDAHLLAACGGYIRGHSGLSEAALLITEHAFTPHIKFSQGRNSFRPYLAPFLWYSKVLLPGAMGGFQRWKPSGS